MKKCKFSEICLNITDGTHSTVVDDKQGKCFLLSCKNIKDGQIRISDSDRKISYETLNSLRKRTKMDINDVVLTSVGTIGQSTYIKEAKPNFEFQRSVAILKPNPKYILSQYLHYYLISSIGQSNINSRIKGAAQLCLFINDIKSMEITLPELTIQQHIVDTIGTVDNLIEKYELEIDKLEKIGLDIYKKKIEKDYTEKPVSELNIKYGVSIPAPKRVAGKYKLYASNGITDVLNQYNAENAIIFGCRGSVGNVYFSKEKCFVLNTAFYIESPKEYGNLYFALVYENGLTLYATGAAQPQITINAILNVNLKVPTDNELNNILDLITQTQGKVDKLKQEKQHLLNKYFS